MAARIHPFKTKTLKLFPTRHFLEIASTRSVLVAGARPDSTHTHVWCLQGYYECPVALASLWRRNHGCTPKSVSQTSEQMRCFRSFLLRPWNTLRHLLRFGTTLSTPFLCARHREPTRSKVLLMLSGRFVACKVLASELHFVDVGCKFSHPEP
jgi:hypothetical protein